MQSKMTHGRGRGRGRTNKARDKQRGGMKFAHAVQKYFIDNGIEYNDLNVMERLITHTRGIQIVWDASTYSFIFELTIPPVLIDPYGLPIGQSVDTHAAYTAVAAGAPELGTRVSTFCAKISFVCDGTNLKNKYRGRNKCTVTSAKANKEADTQRMLFEEFACRRTTAPFVPDVLAHAILTGAQFRTMFGPLLSPPATSATSIFATALSTFTSTKKQGVLGTPNEIYNWIMDWCGHDTRLMIDVIFMEMMDFGRTAPSAPRTTPFQMIYKLRSHQHQLAALRMMANIACVRGKGIMPHDFHEGNGMATADGLQLYLIDWGGIWNLSIPEDRAKVLHDFGRVCDRAFTTSAEEAVNAMKQITAGSSDNQKRVARFPSIEDLCGFFQLTILPTRDENVNVLKDMFEEDLDEVVDFTCVPPNPKYVHHALMMVAFVDFMSNRMNFDDYPYCQCGSVLKVVYPEQDKPIKTSTDITVTAFDDFRTFLKTFAVADFPSNTRLPEVVDLIKENVRLCSSVCSAITVDKLRATSWIDDATKAEARRAKEEEARRAMEEEARRAMEEEARRAKEEEARRAKEEAKARLAEEAKARTAERLMEQAEKKRADAENASRTRLRGLTIAAKTKSTASGVAKSNSKPESKRSQALDAEQLQSTVAHASAARAQGAPEVAVPTNLLRRMSNYLNPRQWSIFKRFERKGGTRKHKRNHKRNTTKRV